ncbi:MAG: WD40 repeat domain-containing protein, partial [Candidatus Thermoplasmatota archaeon]|nr:WD40 repeat domain-containing protein [Candidatus Thermoplasmatota archaeon]
MANSGETQPHRKRGAVLLTFLFLVSVTSMGVQAADSDGDGVQDSADDCPWSAGTSTVDKDGCPDRDGDGTSDFNDGWVIGNPNFQNEYTITSSNDYYAVDYDPNGEFIVTGGEDGFVRIWNASTWTIVRSANTNTDVFGVDFSPDGMYVAAALNDDTINIYHSSNMTSLHGAISVDVGGNDQVNSVEFSPDSSSVAVAIGRDNGNQGTNGEVTVIDVQTGSELYAVNPNGEDRFFDVAHSPDGQYMALAGNSDIYIVNTSSGATTWTFTNPPAAVNAVAWSPDGNYISMCGAWEGQSASFDMYQYASGSWSRIWQKTTSTSCASTTFSADGSQVVAGMYWYQTDGNTARVYESDTGNQVDSFSGPRPGGCSSGNNNQCGVMYGIAWSPDSTHIVTANGRNDEGVYFWFADIDEDNDGYNTTDQGDGVVDAFPSDGTQWDDTDGDGYGDNPAPANEPDECITTPGTSTEDRYGCPDADGDGWSDAGDWAPNDSTQWVDADEDGYGDNPAPANEPDECITTPGTSTEDRYGCPDADGDGWSDAGDWAPNDSTQWVDADEDGYGDNYLFELDEYQLHGNHAGDAVPNAPTQWNDTDGDGYGDNYDNASWDTYRPAIWPGLLLDQANQPDAFPLERTQHMDSDGDWIG